MTNKIKIIQIIPVTKPLVAVFRNKNAPNGIWSSEIHAIELIEDKDGFRYERGVIAWELSFDNTDDISSFLGYAKDLNEAIELYGKVEGK